MSRLLIVDDNQQNLYMLRVLLSANGYQVELATNGAEALECAHRAPPDIVISDILMPVMDGYALCRAWKEDEQLKNIPFIFYTATYTDPMDEDFALSLGADRFIIKPVEPDKFLALLLDAQKGIKAREQDDMLKRVEETAYYKEYNAVLVRKLEAKMLQLEKTNRTLERSLVERKRADEEHLKLQDEMIQVQKMESVGRLAGGIAHDFNNILGVILGYAELALLQLDPSHQLYANIKEIQKTAHRSAALTRQLLGFARKQPAIRKVLDLNDTMAGMLVMLRHLIGEDIELVWSPGADLWLVKMDPGQIDQILVNLCANARDAIAGTGKVVIETGNVVFDAASCGRPAGLTPGEYVRLSVRDSGCGMDEETLSHLFEPFFTTKEIGKSTGLGLSTVYGIVRQNSGHINALSEPALGTTFEIYLPRHAGPAERDDTQAPSASVPNGRETVLLVEDEPQLLKLTRKMLESLGYQVVTAATPSEAIRLAKEHAGEIHLLMTDLIMPKMNGSDLSRRIQERHSHIKVLFMSGHAADVLGSKGFLEEGVQFLPKPYSINELARKVREALDRL